ncbi:MAG: hypothetical protein JST24_04865 [Acidobacteria bacterium]|nr:hypothetical protein [Acidobacteriota bacterium]
MKKGLVAIGILVIAALAAGGFWWSRNRLLPVPIASDASLFVAPNPDPGQDQAVLTFLLPSGPGLHAFVIRQVGEPLFVPSADGGADGGWTGLLAEAVWASPNHRHWRVRLRQAVRLHDGHLLESRWALAALRHMVDGPFQAGAIGTVVDDRTFDLDFPEPWEALQRLSTPGAVLLTGSGPHAIGSGPFRLTTSPTGETYLARFDGYRHGNTAIAEVHVPEDPGLLEGHRWATDITAGRYALAVYPGGVAPDDMAKVRSAPYDQIHMKDGSVWFISRRMRRLHPNLSDWSRTSLYGAWQADMDLPYDPR